ncbi:MAG: nucleotide exchange factor GrpE [Oliverpabstia sp.]
MDNYANIHIPWQGWYIVRRLGGGGFGNVYEIERDLYGEKERAAMKVIKIPKEISDLDDDYNNGMTNEEVYEKYAYIQRYMVEEYRQMLEFKGHSNIVNCHDFSVIQNPHQPGCTIYIRMELLTPLNEVLKKEKFSEPRIIQMGIDICQALEICQRKEIIHRDIKPDNIMMSEFGTFKLGDFGLARTMEKTMSASMAGTDWYMAPEVAKKMKYGKSVDTYSLGLVLYWLLNHYRLPFVPLKERITVKDMENAYRLRMQGKGIPEPAEGSQKLKQIVLKAVSYERDQRYHSAKEMLEDMRSIEKMPQRKEKQEEKNPVQRKCQETAGGKGVFGIYFDAEEIHVRLWIGGETRPILKMPAIYTLDDLSDILTGNRAVNYRKCHREKKLYSVLEAMKKADNSENIAAKESAEEKCCVLMKELKKSLHRASYGKIRDCVITVPVSSLMIQRSVYKAMEEAGFHVIRQFSTAVACAISKAYQMTQNQYFMVCAAANDEQQYVTAVYEDNILEIVESTTSLLQHDRTDTKRGLLKYYAADKTFCRQYVEKAAGYEELSTVAADGAALQGARILGFMKRNILVLDCFPWRAGLEIVEEDKKVCFPLTWMIAEQTTLPAKSNPVSVRLDSGIQGKILRLYIGSAETNVSGRMIREWKLEKVCKGFGRESKHVEAVIRLGTDVLAIEIEIKKPGTEEKINAFDFLQYDKGKDSCVPFTTTCVPKQILQDVWQTAEKFRTDARMLENMNMNPAIGQGIQMIAKQSAELFGVYKRGDVDIQIDVFIEKMLEIADNLEYALKAVGKMECRNEKMLLIYFYKKIRDNLRKLNLIPVEAEGMRFDPYIHHAMIAEQTNGVEEGMITEEIQKGYFLRERLLRPARVKVAK